MKIHDTSSTKIIATLGPSTASEKKIKELIRAGIDICRLNFSHGKQTDHEAIIHRIRKINTDLGTHVAILADLQGPKIRLGKLQHEGTMIHTGNKVIVTNIESSGTSEKIYVNYPNLPKDVKKGHSLLIDDGKIKLEVISSDSSSQVVTKVIHGGPLNSKKGVNLPNTKLSLPSLTEKDIQDVRFILDHDLEWIALSFVRSANDIIELKKLIQKQKNQALVLAKIEKPEALSEIDRIIEVSDAIMIARGDLGVEVSFDEVPYIQKQIIQKSIRKSTPVVVATQMLESMINNYRPTRAEANDVANAVFDCTDAVMLSGETSVGKFPVESIYSMQKIIDYAEETEFVHKHAHIPDINSSTYIPDSVCFNACRMADQSGAKVIVAYAAKVQTAFRLASNRPKAPVCIFTYDRKVISQLSIVWGVWAFYIDKDLNVDDSMKYSIDILKAKSMIHSGDIIVQVSSLPLYGFSGVNTIKLSTI